MWLRNTAFRWFCRIRAASEAFWPDLGREASDRAQIETPGAGRVPWALGRLRAASRGRREPGWVRFAGPRITEN